MSRHPKLAARESSFEGSSRGGFGWGRLCLVLLAAVAALGWFAPTIVTQTGLRDVALRYVLSDFPARIEVGSISAGWLSPIAVRQVAVADAAGGELLEVDSLRSEKPLWSLLMDLPQLGVVRIEQPHIHLVLRDNGSNLEDLLQALPATKSSGRPIACTLEILEGKASIATQVAGGAPQLACTAEHMQLSLELPQTLDANLIARLKGDVSAPNAAAGAFAVDAEFPQPAAGADQAAPSNGQLRVTAQSFPLASLNPLFHRLQLDMQLDGRVTAEAQLRFDQASQSATIQRLAAESLQIAAPPWLGAEPIRLASATTQGEIVRTNGQWKLTGLQVGSDVLHLEISGTAPAGAGAPTGAELVAALQQAAGTLRGRVDVARVAAAAPSVLRIREGTQIQAGEIAWDVQSQPEGQGHRWNGHLESKGITAVHSGQTIQLRQPVVADLDIRQANGAWSIHQLRCESSFLNLTGQGTLDQGQVTAQGDLTQFLREIGQFVNVGSLRAAGKMNSKIAWTRGADQRIQLQGDAAAENLEVATAAMRPWRESRLDVKFSATARAAGTQVAGVDEAQFDLQAAGDRLSARLLEPLADFSARSSAPLTFTLQGDLGQWLDRVQLLVPLKDWQIDGERLDVQGQARVSAQRLELAATKAKVANLRVFGPGVYLREPELQIESEGAWDLAAGELTAQRTTVVGTTVALRADQLRLLLQTPAGVALDGDVQYRTDLERLSSWFVDPALAAPFRLTGAATGAATFRVQQPVTQADLNGTIEGFSFSQPAETPSGPRPVARTEAWREVWQEPRIQFAVQGAYDAQADRLELPRVEAAGESLSVGAAGEVRQPFTVADAQLSGQYSYDLARIAERVRRLLGPQLKMTGSGPQPFSIRGPLLAAFRAPATATSASRADVAGLQAMEQLLAEAGLSWESLAIQGFEIGPAHIQTRMDKGQLSIDPLELPVNEGVVRLAPTVDLTKTPRVVSLAPGVVVDKVRISPEMCRTWMKYVAPLVADATAAEGTFSVELQNARLPATDLASGNVQGTLSVHAARIGPGPLAQELLLLVEQVRSLLDRRPAGDSTQTAGHWLDMPPQQLNLQLADRKVYHRDLQMAVRDVVIRTQGWVGIDQQLALVAEVPVRDEWVAQDRLLSSLKGQSIRLPIQGTLSRPMIDRTALTELSRKAIRDVGTNFLQDQLNRGLERLLPTRPVGQPQP